MPVEFGVVGNRIAGPHRRTYTCDHGATMVQVFGVRLSWTEPLRVYRVWVSVCVNVIGVEYGVSGLRTDSFAFGYRGIRWTPSKFVRWTVDPVSVGCERHRSGAPDHSFHSRYWAGKSGRRSSNRQRFDSMYSNVIDACRIRLQSPSMPPRLPIRTPLLESRRIRLDDRFAPAPIASSRGAGSPSAISPSQSRALQALDATMSSGPPCRVHEPWCDALLSTRRLVRPATVHRVPRRSPRGGAPISAGGRCPVLSRWAKASR